MSESVADLILASASPRRSELLRQIGVRFTILAADIDESKTGARVTCRLCVKAGPGESPGWI